MWIPLPLRLLCVLALGGVGRTQAEPVPPLDVVARAVAAAFDPRADYPTTLPFAAMRETAAGRIEVQLGDGDGWQVWQAIDGVPAARIVAVCRQAFGGSWWKRLTEDLPQVVGLMGTELTERVRVTVVDAAGREVEHRDVPMTHANRQAVKAAGHQLAAAEPAAAERHGPLAARLRAEFDPRRPVPTTLPFVAMEWAASGIVVRLADDPTSYRWLAIDGVAAADVEAACRAAFGPRWWKRITEDLPQVLAIMGNPVGEAVDLELEAVDTGETLSRRRVPMTFANRRTVKATTREPSAAAAPEAPPSLRADVEVLGELLGGRWSYAHLRGDAVPRALAELRRQAAEPLPAARAVLALQECIAAGGDGHAALSGWERLVGGPWLPFLVEEVDNRFLAIRADRTDYFQPGHPYLVALDGQPLSSWLETAARVVPQGAPHAIRRRAVRTLRAVQALRLLRGRSPAATLPATFADAAGAQMVATVTLTEDRPIYGDWPRPAARMHRLLDGGIGYLRIAEMRSDPDYLAAIDAAMAELRDSRGLVVDVRGNGGGSRDVLRRFLPYLLDDDSPARVVNIAAYRHGCVPESSAMRGEALADRGLHPVDWPGWSDVARRAILAAAAAFRPAWQPAPAEFGPWHYCVVERRDNPAAYRYRAPVSVLIDGDCFSATDVFVGALAGMDGVTLLGRPTCGGSGRARRYRLPSGLEVRLSTMASFRPDGTPYDGRGIAPDVAVEPAAGDFLGRGDRVLDAALTRLRR